MKNENLYISVIGGGFEEIVKLVECASREYIVNPYTTWLVEDGTIIVNLQDSKEAERLTNYIWKWLSPKYKQKNDVRFYKGGLPNYNMRLISSMLW